LTLKKSLKTHFKPTIEINQHLFKALQKHFVTQLNLFVQRQTLKERKIAYFNIQKARLNRKYHVLKGTQNIRPSRHKLCFHRLSV
jgi:hypothetical protein